MRSFLLYIIINCSGLNFQNKPRITKWVITSGCSLKVDGSTNINNFSCIISNYNQPDTIWVTRSINSPVQLSGNIQLDVQKFDCHNPIMTADLRKTLKAKAHPKLTIRFVSLARYPGEAGHNIKGMVTIELAGTSKMFEVSYRVIAAESAGINLIGSRVIKFSDFNITPPRKLGGMIKTNNDLSVEFNLRMKVL